MQAFTLIQPPDIDAAVAAAAQDGTKYIAGGTDLLQLAKDYVETPARLIDLEPLPLSGISADANTLRLEAMARMSDVGEHPVVRSRWPVLSQALLASASPQIRNMGTMGGNLMQAILGGSAHCIATHPSDFAVALVALDAMVEVHGPNGTRRTLPIGELHRLPGDTPHRETNLEPGEMIGAIVVPASAAAKRSHYLKMRDRSSFEFALVSAAVAMELEDNTIRDIRVAAGGVGTKPWRLPEVEAALSGKALSPDTLSDAAGLAGQGAQPASQNAFKLTLLRRTVLRALQTVSA